MTYSEAVEYFGSQTELATALGISQPTVSVWGKKRGKKVVPELYQYQLEVITEGALKVDPELRMLGSDRDRLSA